MKTQAETIRERFAVINARATDKVRSEDASAPLFVDGAKVAKGALTWQVRCRRRLDLLRELLESPKLVTQRAPRKGRRSTVADEWSGNPKRNLPPRTVRQLAALGLTPTRIVRAVASPVKDWDVRIGELSARTGTLLRLDAERGTFFAHPAPRGQRCIVRLSDGIGQLSQAAESALMGKLGGGTIPCLHLRSVSAVGITWATIPAPCCPQRWQMRDAQGHLPRWTPPTKPRGRPRKPVPTPEEIEAAFQAMARILERPLP